MNTVESGLIRELVPPYDPSKPEARNEALPELDDDDPTPGKLPPPNPIIYNQSGGYNAFYLSQNGNANADPFSSSII
jgi:hypothetical protein